MGLQAKYRIMICDDSAMERRRFYQRQFNNFRILGVERQGQQFVETDPMDSIDKLYMRLQEMKKAGDLPDLVILDLFYKRSIPDVEERERKFVADVVALKSKFRQLRSEVLGYLEPTGIRLLQRLRQVDRITAEELPVAVYTDKDFNLLPPEDFNLLYGLDAATLHKDRDENPDSQITPAAEYLRLLHIIEHGRSVPQSHRKIFISHGTSTCWKDIQKFIERELLRSTIELAQNVSRGKTVIAKLEEAADSCSHAVIVMTRDDKTASGTDRVRENVMHEIGYFQGRLGLDRVILLREKGVSMPSNLGGIVYLPFTRNRLDRVFQSLAAELGIEMRRK